MEEARNRGGSPIAYANKKIKIGDKIEDQKMYKKKERKEGTVKHARDHICKFTT